MEREFVWGIFSKSPKTGYIKTRIAEELGEPAALELHKNLLLNWHHFLGGKGIDYVYCLEPEPTKPNYAWFNERKLPYLSATGKTFGEQLQSVFHLLKGSYAAVCISCSDLPELDDRLLTEVTTSLHVAGTAVGQCPDGGWYVFVSNTYIPELFTGLSYGNRSAFSGLVHKLRDSGFTPNILKERPDLDTIADISLIDLQKIGYQNLRQQLAAIQNRLREA